MADCALAVAARAEPARRNGQQYVAADCALEDFRQSAPQPRRARVVAVAAGRLDVAAGRALVVDAVCALDGELSDLRARHYEFVVASARRAVDELFLARLGRFRHEYETGRADADVSAASSLGDARRRRARGLSQIDFRQTSARMGDGGASRKQQPSRPRGVLEFNVSGNLVRSRHGVAHRRAAASSVVVRAAAVIGVGAVAVAGLFRQPQRNDAERIQPRIE